MTRGDLELQVTDCQIITLALQRRCWLVSFLFLTMYNSMGSRNPRCVGYLLPVGTAAPWPHQKCSSNPRHVVLVFVELPYLCRFTRHHCVSPSFFKVVQQRWACIQKGFYLMILICSACGATFLFQVKV